MLKITLKHATLPSAFGLCSHNLKVEDEETKCEGRFSFLSLFVHFSFLLYFTRIGRLKMDFVRCFSALEISKCGAEKRPRLRFDALGEALPRDQTFNLFANSCFCYQGFTLTLWVKPFPVIKPSTCLRIHASAT